MDQKVLENQTDAPEKTRPRVSTRAAAIAGFSLVGLAVLALLCTVLITFVNANNKVVEAEVTSFKNEKQILTKLKSVIKSSNELYSTDAKYIKGINGAVSPTDSTVEEAAENAKPVSSDASGAQSRLNNTADTVKTDDKYIYYLESGGGSRITVFSAEGKNSKYVCEITISNKEPETFIFKDFSVNGDTLTAIEEAAITASGESSRSYTRVEVFDISDIKNAKKTDSFIQSGSYYSSEIVENSLCVTSIHYASDENDLPRAIYGGDLSDESSENNIPAENTYCVENPDEPNFAVTSIINTENSAEPVRTNAVLGSSGGAFCGNYLYITAYDYNEGLVKKQNIDGASYTHLPVDSTQLIKFDLKNSLEKVSSAKVCGYVDNSYSFNENGDCLRLASTVTLDNDKFTESANIFVLDKNLRCLGKITDFANNESIKAVRYIDDTAYAITYKDSDPLFIIDLKNNEEPRILGEVKISGFSSTLVSVDSNTLLSVGYYTAEEDSDDRDGVRLVTFDVSNKSNPKKTDEKIFKNYESAAQYNSNALLCNPDKSSYVIPMTYENYNESDGVYEAKYGMLSFTVENGKINVQNDYISTVLSDSDESSASIDRCVYGGDCVYLLGSVYNYYKNESTALIDAVEYK